MLFWFWAEAWYFLSLSHHVESGLLRSAESQQPASRPRGYLANLADTTRDSPETAQLSSAQSPGPQNWEQ